MTNGIGGSTAATELAKLTSQRDQTVAIGLDEYGPHVVKNSRKKRLLEPNP